MFPFFFSFLFRDAFQGKSIISLVNSALNCTRKPISHESRSDECDIGFRVQFNAEFPRQVMNFPVKWSYRWRWDLVLFFPLHGQDIDQVSRYDYWKYRSRKYFRFYEGFFSVYWQRLGSDCSHHSITIKLLNKNRRGHKKTQVYPITLSSLLLLLLSSLLSLF